MNERPAPAPEVDDESQDGTGEANPIGKTPVRRRRGQIRLKALIEATDALLQEHDVSEVGLYQIAEQAGVPPASIYHFFPNKEAALVALAEDYLERLVARSIEAPPSPPANWQELIGWRIRTSARFYNEHVPLMRLFLGASISAEVRQRDMAGTLAVSRTRAEMFDRHFVMPPIKDWIGKLATSLAIADGIWALSYSQNQSITDESIEEGVRAVTAYLRCYLPEWIEPRDQTPGS
ncbi:TetR/AcrR family transcriptional regulator [Ancylobacter defluvii]|uniref:TetR family transcriptional regulator n=1 Tax=Ancylobacter defluvii TaxID=1282440 RepID=A0A9W6K280_9HYPH|nr:TetR/AcrR family transcriptional regulator [Ancylobacter defluvii]MBS7586828.1 TetR/AcrR family transcriptional regulator [Ancylobacter defluvii]GLK86134.1 TetR family transcriptional regulator [Ancylobacter defluvii]